MMVKVVGVVEVKSKRVDASRSYYTRVLLNKLDVDNFSKNFFRALHSEVSCHVEL